jgi:hypothetical protein
MHYTARRTWSNFYFGELASLGENSLVKESLKCTLCGEELTEFKYRPMHEWNISGMLCGQCYDKRLIEHYIQPDRRNITKR